MIYNSLRAKNTDNPFSVIGYLSSVICHPSPSTTRTKKFNIHYLHNRFLIMIITLKFFYENSLQEFFVYDGFDFLPDNVCQCAAECR